MKDQISIRLPEYSINEIEDLKNYYKDVFGDVQEPTTTDIIRRAIHYLWCDSRPT